MKKRWIATLLVLAMALSLMPQVAFAAEETVSGSYQVGYSKVDINPYKDEANNLLASIPMGGYRYTTTRLSNEDKLDDNGDGKVTKDDGIFVTCTAVTDKVGNTALFFNCDLLWVFESLQLDVLKKLLSDEAFAKYDLSADLIYFNGSHNHFAPLVNSVYSNSEKYPDFAEAYTAWVQRVESQMVAGALAALEDRAGADMYKGSVDVSEYFTEDRKSTEYVGDMLNSLREDASTHVDASKTYTDFNGNIEEVFFNCVRQYKITEQKVRTLFGSPMKDFSGNYVVDSSASPVTYVADDGTNGGIKFVGNLHTIYQYDATTGEKTSEVEEYRVIQSVEPVTDVDDKLHLVEFKFVDGSNKDSVVWLNWRGHLPSTANVSTDNSEYENSPVSKSKSFFQVSSGMVNSLRYAMLQAGYRVAFFQGTGGNVNMIVKGISELSWINTDAHATQVHNVYGTELAEIALYALDASNNVMTQVNEDGGQIRGTRQNLQTTLPTYTAFQYLAGLQFQAANSASMSATGGGIDGPRVYKSSLYYYVDANGNPLIDTANQQLMTDADGNLLTNPSTKATYTNADGSAITVGQKVTCDTAVVIPSIFQANAYVDRYAKSGQEGEKLALSVLTIGDDFSVIAAGTELFDRYTDNGTNMWDAVKEKYNDSGIFILGYTNTPGGGYMPSAEAYTYSQNSNTESYAVGIYESTTSPYAEGTGETVVEQLDIMLRFLKSGYQAAQSGSGVCAHCGKLVTWTDLSKEVTEGELQFYPYLRTGHYYLSQDVSLRDMETGINTEVCINLNGKTLSVYRAIEVKDDTTLSVMDNSAEGTGKVVGYEALRTGGVFYVAKTGTLNLYSGTYCYEGVPNSEQSSGGVVYVVGRFNMYDGLIEGTSVNHCGGAVHVEEAGRADLRGGILRGGTAKYGSTMTSNGKVVLAGNTYVQSLYNMGGTSTLHFDSAYTGTVSLAGMSDNALIGSATADADISLARITWWSGSVRCYPEFQKNEETGGFDVYKRVITDYVAQNAETGEFIYGDYVKDDNTVNADNILTNVIETLPEGSRIVLLEGNTPTAVALNADKNLHLELKARTFNGAITVAEGKTLYVSDFATADYDVTDAFYTLGSSALTRGKLAGTITGNVAGWQAEDEEAVYVKVTEGSKLYFHAVKLNIDQLVLRANYTGEDGSLQPGLYFKHQFAGDTTVAGLIESYGIAFSIADAPTAADLQASATAMQGNVYKSGDVIYTNYAVADFPYGTTAATNTSTLISGIMKQENGYNANKAYAAMPIYGTAYVKLTTGEYVLGVTRARSLQQQLEGIDTVWENLTQTQRNGVLKMYKTGNFGRVINTWNVPNLTNPAKSQDAVEENILRVLSIGNSHTDNATEYLYDVFQAENPDQQVQIAQLYYSGCSVSQHVNFAANDQAVYRYRTHDNRNPSGYATMKQALQAEVWDVIILHEMNNSAGAASTYTGKNKLNLQKHINYVKNNSLNSDPKLIWNFSWSNPTSQTLWDLGYPGTWVENYQNNYGANYDTLLNKMIANTKQYVMTNSAFSDVAPTGLAFKHARDNNPAEDKDLLLYCDYTHAGEGFGRLLASYVWYATLTGQTEITELKVTKNLTDAEQTLLLNALNYALANKASLLP